MIRSTHLTVKLTLAGWDPNPPSPFYSEWPSQVPPKINITLGYKPKHFLSFYLLPACLPRGPFLGNERSVSP